MVSSVDWCAILMAEEGFKFKPAQFNLGGTCKFSDVARGRRVALEVRNSRADGVRHRADGRRCDVSGVANCHGGNGEGAIGPALTGVPQRMDLATTSQWIENPSAKMPKLYPAPLNAQAVKTVAAYVQGLK